MSLILLLSSFLLLTQASKRASHFPIRSSCFDIHFCREVSGDGFCDLECTSADCSFDGGDCDSINDLGGKLILALHISPNDFMFVSHRFLSEISTITSSLVELSRDADDLLVWEWNEKSGPKRRLYPERDTMVLDGIEAIEVMISVKIIGCSNNCEKEIERSIRSWRNAVEDNKVSPFLSQMLYRERSIISYDYIHIIIYYIVLLFCVFIIIICGLFLCTNRKKRESTVEGPVWHVPDIGVEVSDIIKNKVKEIRLEEGERSPLHCIVSSDSISIEEDIEALLKCGESINTLDKDGRSILHLAIQHMRPHRFIHWLIQKGADASIVDDKDQSLLHLCVSNFDYELIKLLLSYNSVLRMINFSDYRNMTPLKLAMSGGPIDIVRELIDRGANIDCCGETANDDPLQCSRYPIHLSILNNNKECVLYLIDRGASINIRDNHGRTPLHYAAMYCDMKMVEILVEIGLADLILEDDHNMTAEMIAKEKRKYEMAEYLNRLTKEMKKNYQKMKRRKTKTKKQSMDGEYGSSELSNSIDEGYLTPIDNHRGFII